MATVTVALRRKVRASGGPSGPPRGRTTERVQRQRPDRPVDADRRRSRMRLVAGPVAAARPGTCSGRRRRRRRRAFRPFQAHDPAVARGDRPATGPWRRPARDPAAVAADPPRRPSTTASCVSGVAVAVGRDVAGEARERDARPAVRSTVTTLLTDARLFEASAVQSVIRYAPSATTAPAAFLPSQVKATVLPACAPGPQRRPDACRRRAAGRAQPKRRWPVTVSADRGRVQPAVAVGRQERRADRCRADDRRDRVGDELGLERPRTARAACRRSRAPRSRRRAGRSG